jgi:hypothetical protein
MSDEASGLECFWEGSVSAIYPLFIDDFECFDLIFIWMSKRMVYIGTL